MDGGINPLNKRQEAALELLRRRAARDNLLDFTQYTYPAYRVSRMHRLISEKLTAVAEGRITRLMIFCPPRHGKSRLVSIEFPAWYLGKFSDKQLISASYNSDLASDFSRDVRNLIDSAEYGVLFSTKLAQDSQAKDRWHTSAGGGYVAAGINGGQGTAITGRGAHILNIDDPIKNRAEAESESTRNGIWKWYISDAYTRLMPGGAVILTVTRWHEDDLAGRLIAAQETGGDKWDVLELPATNDNGAAADNPLGAYEALWPESYPRSVLDQIKAVQGIYDWEALYQQHPRPPGGSFFDEADFLDNEGQPFDPPQRCASVFAIIDSASKTGKTNDGTGVVYFSYDNSNVAGRPPLMFLDYDYVQIEGDLLINWLPNVFASLQGFAKQCGARAGSLGAFIEDKVSGTILIQAAQRRNWPAQAIDSKLTSVGKVERGISISGYVRQRKVGFTRQAFDRTLMYKGATRNHLLNQLLRFHVGTKDMVDDDLFDCGCYGIALALGNSGGF